MTVGTDMRHKLLGLIAASGLLILATPQTPMFAADPDLRVVRAAKNDDPATVRALLRQRADVASVDGEGATAVLWAAHWNNLEIVRALIQAGARVDTPNRLGVSPLLEAARLGNAEMIDVLLKAGANPNADHPDGETPLMAASETGNVNAVRLLVRAGATVNAKEDWQEQTPLMWAATEGHLDVINALLEAGADMNVVAKPSELNHHRGTFAGGRGFTDHSSRGLTAVMFAARQGNTDVVRRLARAGADLKHANPDGVTALMIAIINDHFDTAAALIEDGAPVNEGSLYQAVEMHNLAPIVTATDATRPRPNYENTIDSLALIQLLLDKGADPNKVFNGQLHWGGSGANAGANSSPLVRAALAGDAAAIKLMVAKGADVNRPDEIVLASQGGFGGAPTPPANAGMTPLMAAIGGGGGGRGGFGGAARGGPQFREASERGALPAVTAMLESPRVDVNAVSTSTGETAAHRAAAANNVQILQLLADRGAKLDVKSTAGFTPLDTALGRGAAAAPARGGGGGGGGVGGRGGGAPAVQANAARFLRQRLGLPDEPLPAPAPPAGRGGDVPN